MNKMIGYGASLLLLAATGGLLFGASTAQADGDIHPPPPSMEDKCDEICECVKAALDILNDPEVQGRRR